MFQKVSLIEKNDAFEKGIARFSVKFFSSHIIKTFRRGTFRSFKKSRKTKNLCSRGEATPITIFRLVFCLAVPNFFVGEPFCVSENFGYQKILCISVEGAFITIWRQKFLSHSTKNNR